MRLWMGSISSFSLGGDDAITLQPAAVGLPPCVPQSGKGVGFFVLHGEGVGPFRLGVDPLPLVEAIYWDEAAPTLEGYAPHRGLHQCFGLGVDRRQTLEIGKAYGVVRDKTPAHQYQLALAGLFVVADDGLEGGGSNVVVGLVEHKVGEIPAHVEMFGDFLFVRSTVVAATH